MISPFPAAQPSHVYNADGSLAYVDTSYRDDFFVSATQVGTAELCSRKWAWRYIDKIKAPPNKFAQLGVDTHGHLEKWLAGSIVPIGEEKEKKLAQALIPMLPPPQYVDRSHVEMNQLYSFLSHDVHFIMVVDLFVPYALGGVPRVFDHKTGSNPDYWLTPETLPRDIQGSLYGAWAMHKTGSPVVDLQWNYVKTKGAMTTKPVVARVDGYAISERLEKSIDTGKRLRMIAQSGARAMDIEYDARGCSAYGGCPYQDRCNLSIQDRVRSIMTMDPNTQQFMNQIGPNGQPLQAQPQQPWQPPPQQGYPQQPYPGQPAINPPAMPGPQGFPPAQPGPMFAPPPQAVTPPVMEKARSPGRPKKETKDDPWVAFAVAALPIAAQGATDLNQLVHNTVFIADALHTEMLKRKE